MDCTLALTPALSPQERGPFAALCQDGRNELYYASCYERQQDGDGERDVDRFKMRAHVLPFPEGEGRGGGERLVTPHSFCFLLFCSPAFAHELRPAHLKLRQTGPDTHDALWKVPGYRLG